ncbi:hypothetical protein TMatcc_008695 [Talaromyces marneffei ATCC 18224]|uniref:AB hydrolase-1 domain-containing protein n=1 Tax=Talaromyces marneffei (strain ATCC 18224 / CBS 334.59 / QM 7333) TaxID=441960 RepID=B6QLA4_TALMQ|nr:uncharacterized protein EYB26_008020 [Talaromyces marneffei]EEA21881.1 conserved hypothetical protein [Talaromyces marneffei ATCC 18224]KAE8550648.1 hypothetical protein EYB25_006876 [Talaromyces marneffei]QGA20318.1 hypothetical protein EYB26_008020 [Talaromyces marneffei]
MKTLTLSLATFTSSITFASAATKVCQNYKIPLTVTSENFVYDMPYFADNYDVVDWISNFGSRTASVDYHPFSNTKQNQTASYTISATFCTPKDPEAAYKDTVLFATHGLNFDNRYWASEIQPDNYSFVDYAINRGYSIFYYDRLGVGASTKVSGYTNQLPIQIEIATQLIISIKSSKYTGSLGKPDSLVVVGHSFGSAISAGTVAANPEICDALILTGFSYNGSNPVGFVEAAQLRIASSEDPRWRKLDTGYLLPVDIYSNVNTFFKKPDYDLNVVRYADSIKQPLGLVEVLTGASSNLSPSEFTGKAMVIAGQYDFIFCTGQCDDVIEYPAANVFAKAKDFKAISYPGAGHGLNFALNATGAYAEIFDFLEK